MSKKTLIIGASDNPSRYSYLAANRLTNAGHEIVLLGKRPGTVVGEPIETEPQELDDVHTVTLYLRPQLQEQYYDYIIGLKPKRIIFNPGTDNQELARLAKEKGIETVSGCTLVMLSSNTF